MGVHGQPKRSGRHVSGASGKVRHRHRSGQVKKLLHKDKLRKTAQVVWEGRFGYEDDEAMGEEVLSKGRRNFLKIQAAAQAVKAAKLAGKNSGAVSKAARIRAARKARKAAEAAAPPKPEGVKVVTPVVKNFTAGLMKMKAKLNAKKAAWDLKVAANTPLPSSKKKKAKDYDAGKQIVVEMPPGQIGMQVSEDGGQIQELDFKGQAKLLGVKNGWKIVGLDDAPYTKELLKLKIAGVASYKIKFSKAEIAETVVVEDHKTVKQRRKEHNRIHKVQLLIEKKKKQGTGSGRGASKR